MVYLLHEAETINCGADPVRVGRVTGRQRFNGTTGTSSGATWNSLNVFGDFEICPLEPERKGERQYACVESTKITFVPK